MGACGRAELARGRAPRQQQRDAEPHHEQSRALPQPLEQRRPAQEIGARRVGGHDDDVGERVQRDRDQAKRYELQRRVDGGRIQELRDEGRKNAAVFGLVASTTIPSRNARALPAARVISGGKRPALRKARTPSQIR